MPPFKTRGKDHFQMLPVRRNNIKNAGCKCVKTSLWGVGHKLSIIPTTSRARDQGQKCTPGKECTQLRLWGSHVATLNNSLPSTQSTRNPPSVQPLLLSQGSQSAGGTNHSSPECVDAQAQRASPWRLHAPLCVLGKLKAYLTSPPPFFFRVLIPSIT